MKINKLFLNKNPDFRPGRKPFLVLLALLLLGQTYCSPSVERYKNKARKALQNEDSQKAREYLQKAFDVSLDSDNFPTGKGNEYSNAFASADRNKIILIENNPSHIKAYFTVYEIAKDDDWTRRIKGFIHTITLSPNGHYALLHLETEQDQSVNEATNQNKKHCSLSLWDLEKKEALSFEREILCSENAGISDDGKVIFIGTNQTVVRYNLANNDFNENYIKKLPASPIKNVTPRSSFQFSPHNKLFLTYGELGLYYLYSVDDKEFKLISKDGASPKILFLPNNDNPGLITGGANNHKITFFNFESLTPKKTYPVRFWKDAVFLTENEYYYIEDDRLAYVNDKQDEKLPFWAVRLFADAGRKVYFLTPTGRLISYNKISPSKESQRIFKLGWEIK